MTEPREALAALLEQLGSSDTETPATNGPDVYQEWGMTPGDFADRLIAAGVHLGDEGLRAAAQAVVDQADPDDDPEGQFIEFLVPFDAIDALRAALVAADRLTEGDSR